MVGIYSQSKKIREGYMEYLNNLHNVKSDICKRFKNEANHLKTITNLEEIEETEQTNLYHHEIHQKGIQKSIILEIEHEGKTYTGNK